MNMCDKAEHCPDRRKSDRWHINKTIDLTLVGTVLGGLIVLGVYVSSQATRQSLTEQAIIYVTSDQKRQDDDMKALRIEIKDGLESLDAKVTRLLEKK